MSYDVAFVIYLIKNYKFIVFIFYILIKFFRSALDQISKVVSYTFVKLNSPFGEFLR